MIKRFNRLFIFVLLGSLTATAPVFALQKNDNQQTKDVLAFLRRLEEKNSDVRTIKTDFIQEKELSAFKNKIVIKGRIYLSKPDKIAWHVDEPVKYSVLITDSYIRQWDEETGQVQEISFSRVPVLREVFAQLNGWFKGNYLPFMKDYQVKLVEIKPLSLEFRPKGKTPARKMIKSISIAVREDERYLKSIRIEDISGDTTTINFHNTILNSSLDPSLFEVEPGG